MFRLNFEENLEIGSYIYFEKFEAKYKYGFCKKLIEREWFPILTFKFSSKALLADFELLIVKMSSNDLYLLLFENFFIVAILVVNSLILTIS